MIKIIVLFALIAITLSHPSNLVGLDQRKYVNMAGGGTKRPSFFSMIKAFYTSLIDPSDGDTLNEIKSKRNHRSKGKKKGRTLHN